MDEQIIRICNINNLDGNQEAGEIGINTPTPMFNLLPVEHDSSNLLDENTVHITAEASTTQTPPTTSTITALASAIIASTFAASTVLPTTLTSSLVSAICLLYIMYNVLFVY